MHFIAQHCTSLCIVLYYTAEIHCFLRHYVACPAPPSFTLCNSVSLHLEIEHLHIAKFTMYFDVPYTGIVLQYIALGNRTLAHTVHPIALPLCADNGHNDVRGNTLINTCANSSPYHQTDFSRSPGH